MNKQNKTKKNDTETDWWLPEGSGWNGEGGQEVQISIYKINISWVCNIKKEKRKKWYNLMFSF